MNKQHAPRIDDYVNELLGEDTDPIEAHVGPQAAEDGRAAESVTNAGKTPPSAPGAMDSPGIETVTEVPQTPPEQTEAGYQSTATVQSVPAAPSSPLLVPENFPLDLEKWLEPVNREADEQPVAPPLRCVSFQIQGQHYAAEVNSLLEVLARADIVPIPSMRLPVLGILNLRGSIVTVLDPALPLGLSPVHDQPGQVLVADYQGEPVALRVDSVGEVVSLEEDAVRNPPQAAEHVRGLAELGDDMLTLLDLAKLVKKAFPAA